MARVFIGVGSNIEPERNVREALRRLAREVTIVGVSTFYRSDPVGGPPQPRYVNGVVLVETDMPAADLKLLVLEPIEQALGRDRVTEQKAGPRTIDLDILLYDDLVVSSSTLVLPDPRIEERPFLAVPLSELAPRGILPGTRRTFEEIASSLPGRGMEPLSVMTEHLRALVRRAAIR